MVQLQDSPPRYLNVKNLQAPYWNVSSKSSSALNCLALPLYLIVKSLPISHFFSAINQNFFRERQINHKINADAAPWPVRDLEGVH
ncbi:hypothetical protein PCASD_21516 [Puccinia coronata f. sp. avenae]|uniref:Uncharacterized protein n=1 Tax=Puccinia coronata f. sp. avenae TaxID=200324 RepID=A0A2N5SPC4_9BASI|nr:hypothetical protein PCASD_21516 [Puccinia coronata f. sp. avenae]